MEAKAALSISDHLKELGFGHRPGRFYAKRDVFDLATNEVAGTFDAMEAVQFIKERRASLAKAA